MPTDGDQRPPTEDADMLPDEAAVLADRGELLDEADEEDLLTVEEAADELGIDLE